MLIYRINFILNTFNIFNVHLVVRLFFLIIELEHFEALEEQCGRHCHLAKFFIIPLANESEKFSGWIEYLVKKA